VFDEMLERRETRLEYMADGSPRP